MWQWLIPVLVGGNVLAAATLSSPEQADACLDRLMEITAVLSTAAAQARASNDLVRADCIHDRLTSVTALLEVSHAAQRWLVQSDEDDDPEAVAEQLDKIRTACERAEKLLTAADGCVSVVIRRRPKKAVPLRPRNRKPVPQVERFSPVLSRRATIRSVTNCLRQTDVACLFAQTMEVRANGDCPGYLGARDIEPLGGWEPQACATVEDFCVVAARVLHLEVADPDEPVSYAQALREFGLPVDAVLPAITPGAEPTILLESEACEFLSQGVAGQLPR